MIEGDCRRWLLIASLVIGFTLVADAAVRVKRSDFVRLLSSPHSSAARAAAFELFPPRACCARQRRLVCCNAYDGGKIDTSGQIHQPPSPPDNSGCQTATSTTRPAGCFFAVGIVGSEGMGCKGGFFGLDC